MIKKIFLAFFLSLPGLASFGQITSNQTIGAPHTQVQNRGFFTSDSAIHINSDTIRSARIGSLAIIGTLGWVQSVMNVTDSSWQQIVSSGSVPVTVGPIDSPAASINGLVVINNRIYAQHVTPTNVGLLDPTHFINFEHAWAIVKNTTANSLILYPDTPVHSAFTGIDNVLMGQGAGISITTASTNTAAGQNALFFDLTGGGNVAIGDLACAGCTDVDNVAVGVQALRNSSGSNSTLQTAVGANALSSCTTCDMNTAVGALALTSLGASVSEGNTAVGTQALQALPQGSHNTAMGWLSLNQTFAAGSNDNTAIGFGSNSGGGIHKAILQSTTVGSLAADLNTQGFPLDLFGYETLQDDTTAFKVSAFGFRDINRAGADSTDCLFGDDILSGPSPVPPLDRRNVNTRIFGDSVSCNILGSEANSVEHNNVTIIGSFVYDNTDSLRSNITDISSRHTLTRNNYGNFGDSTMVISLGRGGMTTAQIPTQLISGDIVLNKDSANYQQYDASLNYWFKWRKMLTGSFSQSVVAVTTVTVNLPITIASSAYTVTVTPTAALTATAYYVSAKSPSSFNVTFISALTGTVMFDWGVTLN
jgi:hypothetical protein